MKYSKSNPPLVCMQTQSTCYKGTRTMDVKGVLWHSTGANNPNLKRYVQPSDNATDRARMLALLGTNAYKNDWNHIQRDAGLNGWIGKLADGTVTSIQTMPWNYRPWGCGSGSKGSCNTGWIQFEICEDGLTDPVYFEKVYREACELTAYLCQLYGIDPNGTVTVSGVKIPTILCHHDSAKLGFGYNHADIDHWFPKHGKSMETARKDVAALLSAATAPAATQPKPTQPQVVGDDKAVWDFLRGKGLNAYAAAGIMGNLYAESGIRSNNLQNTGETKLGMTDAQYTAAVDAGTYKDFAGDRQGYGLAQWTYPSRKQNLLDFARAAKKSIGDLAMQLDFLWKEMQGYTGMMTTLRAAKSVREASDSVLLNFERPANQGEEIRAKRAGYGQTFYDKYAGGTQTPQQTPAAGTPYIIRVTASALNVRSGPGTAYKVNMVIKDKGAYTIVEEKNGWGRLKSGAGWISLAYTERTK